MDKELLKKYLNNSCNQEELKIVLEWFKESGRSQECKELLSNFWEDFKCSDEDKGSNLDRILDTIHHKINISATKELLEKADDDIFKYKKKENLIIRLSKIAAFLVIPLLGYGLYISTKYFGTKQSQISANQSYNEIFSSEDAITKVTLPDGSMVWLNHSSTLKYPPVFTGKTRSVELFGEGYFEVKSNPKVPFIVKTEEIETKALGTKFNIMAYPEEERIEVSLINGHVEIMHLEPNGSIITLKSMKPTDLSVYWKERNELVTRTIKDDRYFSWKDGKLIFEKEPIGEVAKKLSRWFNVDIQINDPELYELTYTGTFIHETLPQVMELLSLVSPIRYSISDRQVIDSGMFTKRKVILRYRRN